VLTRPVAVVFAGCVVAGAVAGMAAAAVLGAAAHVLVAAVMAGASTGVAGAAVAVISQPVPAAAGVLADVVHGGMVLAAVAVLVAPALASVFGLSMVDGAGTLLFAGTVAGVACAGALAGVAWRRLADFPAAAISDAARLAGARTDAVVGLEPRYLLQIGERRYWRGRRLRSRSWPHVPPSFAVAWQEWRTLRRRPARLALLAASVALPAAVTGTSPAASPVVLVAVLIGGTAAALAAVSGARHDADHPTTGRWLAVSPGAVLAARSFLPTMLSATWLVAALAVLGHGHWWLLGPAVAPALATAALRMARRGTIDHASMPIVFPMTGTWVPTGWLLWIYSGVDLALIGTAPTLWALTVGNAPTTALLVVQATVSTATLATYLTAVSAITLTSRA
jgi:hypothetical protein